jgi:hypothetical protein
MAIRLAALHCGMKLDDIETHLTELGSSGMTDKEKALSLFLLWRRCHAAHAQETARTLVFHAILTFARTTLAVTTRRLALRAFVWCSTSMLTDDQRIQVVEAFAAYSHEEDIVGLLLCITDDLPPVNMDSDTRSRIGASLEHLYQMTECSRLKGSLYLLYLGVHQMLLRDDSLGRAVRLLHDASGLNSGVHWDGKKWTDTVVDLTREASGAPDQVKDPERLRRVCRDAVTIFAEIARCADIVSSPELLRLRRDGPNVSSTREYLARLRKASEYLQPSAPMPDLKDALDAAYKSLTDLRRYWHGIPEGHVNRIAELLKPYAISIREMLSQQEQRVLELYKEQERSMGRRLDLSEIDASCIDMCVCDPPVVEEWARNAIDNAWRYGGTDGALVSIRCTLRREGRRYVLDLINTGKRPPKDADFFPRDSANRRIREKLRQCGAEMHVQAVEEGEYVCTARVILPAERAFS